MKSIHDLIFQMKEKGYTHDQIGLHLDKLKTDEKNEARQAYVKKHKYHYLLLLFSSFFIFFFAFHFSTIGQTFNSLFITFVSSILFSFFPVSHYFFITSKERSVHIYNKKLFRETEKLIAQFLFYFLLFFIMFYIYHQQEVISVFGMLVGLIILYGISYYFSFIHHLANVMHDRHDFLYKLILVTLVMIGLVFLRLDALFSLVFMFIIFHWYRYSSKELTLQHTTRSLSLFLTGFFFVSFLILLIRTINTTLINSNIFTQNSLLSYLFLSVCSTVLFFIYIYGVRHLLKIQFHVVRSAEYFGSLYRILDFDARYSNFERFWMRIIFVNVLVLCFIFLFVILYNIQSFLGIA